MRRERARALLPDLLPSQIAAATSLLPPHQLYLPTIRSPPPLCHQLAHDLRPLMLCPAGPTRPPCAWLRRTRGRLLSSASPWRGPAWRGPCRSWRRQASTRRTSRRRWSRRCSGGGWRACRRRRACSRTGSSASGRSSSRGWNLMCAGGGHVRAARGVPQVQARHRRRGDQSQGRAQVLAQMLSELHTSRLSLHKYYELYMRAFDEMRKMEMFFRE